MRVATRVRLHSAKPVRRILPPKFTLDNLNSLLSRRLYVSSQRFVSICVELRTGFLLPTSPCDLHDWTGDRVDWRTSSFCTSAVRVLWWKCGGSERVSDPGSGSHCHKQD